MATALASNPSQLKRKQSVAGLPAGSRTVKRRASKACHCCRSRKVRCDVVESGIPCTNCRLDEVECLVTEGKRRRKSYVDGDLLHHSPCASIEEEKELPQFSMFDDIDGLQEFAPSPDPPAAAPTSSLNALEYELSHHKPHMLCETPVSVGVRQKCTNSHALDQTQGHRLSSEERDRRMSAISGRSGRPSFSASAQLLQGSMRYFSPQTSRPDIVLPRYIRPIPPRISAEDLEYLEKKGAFIIPETSLRNELLRCYVQYMHPNLPLLDLQDFLAAIEKNEPGNTVSLLLFQAVMFAATAFIDMRHLTAQGYVTRRAARSAFFHRIKLLYDFDYEVDRVTVVQAVLLMTYWYENPDDPKDVWHWLGVAISLARTIGLNCDTSTSSSLSPQKQRLWKRIWWSCYMRDRLVAIGMRRPMRINHVDFNMPMLELSDFETDALPPELSRMLGGCPAVRDSSKRVTLAKMCIGLAKLCVCITKILVVQYSTLGHKIGATQETTMRLVPKKTATDPCDVIRCDRELEEWHKELPRDLHYFAPDSHERITTNDGEVVNLHRALLTGVYLTAISALHRPQMLPSMPNLEIAPELRELSRRKVREAADDITDMYKDLYAHDLIRYLPNTGVTCLLPAIIIHLLDIKSDDPNIRQVSLRKFQFCMQALQRLREMYASADFAFSFLDAAVRRTNVQIGVPSSSVRPQVTTNNTNKNNYNDGSSISNNGSNNSNNSNYNNNTNNSGSNKTTATTRSDQMKLNQGELLLTPPPEVMQVANRLLFSSTLAPEERNLIAAFTPPGSDRSLNTITTAGTASALDDLEDGESQGGEETNHMMPPLEDGVQLDFDSLINLEGGGDLFASEDGLCVDLNMQWLDQLQTDIRGGDDNLAQGDMNGDVVADVLFGSGYAEKL